MNTIGSMMKLVLEHRGWTQRELARRTDLSPKHICCVMAGKASVTAEVALRLELVLGIPASAWLRLQINADLKKARAKLRKRRRASR